MGGSDLFSMTCSDEIVHWLSTAIYSEFDSKELEAWVFGSVAGSCVDVGDCDVLIVIDESCIGRLARISPIWRQQFEEEFGLRLHLTRLSTQETRYPYPFVRAVFCRPVIRLLPLEGKAHL